MYLKTTVSHLGMHSTPKRPKFDKEMRAERIRQIQDDLNDLTRVLAFKEKRLQQAEAGRNYRVCEQITEEMMELKSRLTGAVLPGSVLAGTAHKSSSFLAGCSVSLSSLAALTGPVLAGTAHKLCSFLVWHSVSFAFLCLLCKPKK